MLKILLIDDDDDFRETSRFVLESAGFDVSQASNPEEGVEKVRTERPDLVILDVVMPRQGGIEVFQGIRKINPRAKVILSSGYSPQIDALSRIVGQGVPFLPKPCPLGKLSEAVEAALAG